MKKNKIGNIVGTHALKGELKIRSTSDFSEERFKVGKTIYIQYNKEYLPYEICTKRLHKTNYLVSFKDHQDINLVEKYVGCPVYANKEEVVLQEDEYLVDDLIGCKVYSGDQLIGTVTSVIDNGRHDILVVEHDNNKRMIPYVDAFIQEEDIDHKIIRVLLIEGM